jgi:dTDP-4-dehydrorhamnose 3,5-epimerase
MKTVQTSLDGVLLLEPLLFGDDRGYFLESYNEKTYLEAGIDARFIQTNVSRSARGVMRGLHYQWPSPQGKLVTAVEGEVYDVAVDVRLGSPTFGKWEGFMLTAENHRHLWIPEGFAHGFCVLSSFATFIYQCTSFYNATADRSVRWNDGSIGIDWPVEKPLLSPKDAQAPFLTDISADQLPIFTP